MTVSEKHINAAMSLNSLAQECLILDKSSEEAVSAIAAALASAEREGMMRAATFAAIHSQYPIENDYDRGYAQGAKDAAARIRREANTHSQASPLKPADSAGSVQPSADPATLHASRNGRGE